MWSNRELKKEAKQALKKNYWRAVFISIVMAVIGIGVFSAKIPSNKSEDDYYYVIDYNVYSHTLSFTNTNRKEDIGSTPIAEMYLAAVSAVMLLAVLLKGVFTILFANPLAVGIKYFYRKSFDEQGKAAMLMRSYDDGYLNCVKVKFLVALNKLLWTLLLIVPGIIRHYEYYLVDYIIADYPDITTTLAIELSTELMQDIKFKVFLLELSFIGWYILSIFTFGISDVFYSKPYRNYTYAALYKKLIEDALSKNTDVKNFERYKLFCIFSKMSLVKAE